MKKRSGRSDRSVRLPPGTPARAVLLNLRSRTVNATCTDRPSPCHVLHGRLQRGRADAQTRSTQQTGQLPCCPLQTGRPATEIGAAALQGCVSFARNATVPQGDDTNEAGLRANLPASSAGPQRFVEDLLPAATCHVFTHAPARSPDPARGSPPAGSLRRIPSPKRGRVSMPHERRRFPAPRLMLGCPSPSLWRGRTGADPRRGKAGPLPLSERRGRKLRD
jgi:hypothetical protein